ncbi:MAG: hypothetical protein F6K47_41090 [Symploca sp. SIO2E6]|nr:hypothetical protein [Symploca sp. SIO2E6]
MANSSTLRLIYQCELGNQKICDRTWYRIKKRLGITKDKEERCDPETLELVKAYAFMRSLYPKGAITKTKVMQYIAIKKHLPEFSCSGKELQEVLQCLIPSPSDATIYRWGKEIGCKFSVYRIYNKDEINKWVEFLARNPNFSFPYSRVKKVG